MNRILDNVDFPQDIKNLKISELNQLASEIREFIIETSCKTGGHVAPSLGAVEIAIAIHYVFDSPRDRIVWDVGHQAYAHKILTGRKGNFSKLRCANGVSGFNNIFESEHDALTVGHAGTSISAALGMAVARDLRKEDYNVISVTGDGSLTNGLVYEAFNNIAQLRPKLILVVNDNKMSISKNVGGISQYLNRLETTTTYATLKNELWELLGHLPDKASVKARDIARRMKESLKNFFVPTILFEEFGIRYIGPIDGHDLNDLISTLKSMKHYNGPIMLHALTRKGKGYIHAENNPTKFHGLGQFNPETGKAEKGSDDKIKYTDVFGKTLVELCRERKDVAAITAAMPDGTGLSHFRDAYPDRFFDVGIAEAHAVEFAVGMALRGIKPVCAIYSTFLQRSYDQLIHDAALMNQNVFFVLDRAGIVGEDGPTHHGLFDLSYLRTVPGMVIMSPKDEDELRSMVKLGIDYDKGPIALRYPRGSAIGVDISGQVKDIKIGKSELILKGSKVLILALGQEVYPALEAAQRCESDLGFTPTVVNMRFINPFDNDTVMPLIETHDIIITAEENILAGGMGEMMLRHISNRGLNKKVMHLGIPDIFVEMGTQKELRSKYALDAEGVYNTIKKAVK